MKNYYKPRNPDISVSGIKSKIKAYLHKATLEQFTVAEALKGVHGEEAQDTEAKVTGE